LAFALAERRATVRRAMRLNHIIDEIDEIDEIDD
jgi:hypothetical protein